MRTSLSVGIFLALGAVVFSPACTRPTSSAGTTTGSSSSAPTTTPLFGAYGGVGTVPDPLPPGYETSFATSAFDVDATSAAPGLAVKAFDLLDGKGRVIASLKRVVEVVELPGGTPPGKRASGSWAFYLNPTGTPFAGTLASGRTRLRVHVALDRTPVDVARYRVQLASPAWTAPLVIEAPIDGAWPT